MLWFDYAMSRFAESEVTQFLQDAHIEFNETEALTLWTDEERYYLEDEGITDYLSILKHTVLLEHKAPIASKFAYRTNDFFYMGKPMYEATDEAVWSAQTPQEFVVSILGCYRKDGARAIFSQERGAIEKLVAISRFRDYVHPEMQIEMLHKMSIGTQPFISRSVVEALGAVLSKQRMSTFLKSFLTMNNDYQLDGLDNTTWISKASREELSQVRTVQNLIWLVGAMRLRESHRDTFVQSPNWMSTDVPILRTAEDFITNSAKFKNCLTSKEYIEQSTRGISFVTILNLDTQAAVVEFNKESIVQMRGKANADLTLDEQKQVEQEIEQWRL